MRENRQRYHELTPVERFKNISRSYANVYQGRGKLTPGPCEACGVETVEKHHEDYAVPLAVNWLCRDCHMTVHKLKGGQSWD